MENKLDFMLSELKKCETAYGVLNKGVKLIDYLQLDENERNIVIWEIYIILANQFEGEMWDDMHESVKKNKIADRKSMKNWLNKWTK